MDEIVIPSSFPRSEQSGAVPGAQPKYLARLIDGKFVTGATDGEVRARYEACEDLSQQFASYAEEKLTERCTLSLDDLLGRIEASIRKKVRSGTWSLSVAEIDWILNRVRRIRADDGSL